jgi:hypothetical protein
MKILFTITLLSISSTLNAVCPTSSMGDEEANSESEQVAVVERVKWPGTSYTPSTGKELRVFLLDDTMLRGKFVSHDNRVLYFKSTCSGLVHVWRQDGSNIIEHEIVSESQGIHFAKIEERTFVYGSTAGNGTYRLPEHRSRREAEEEYSERTALGHASDDQEVSEALNELESDSDAHLLSKLSQALGEFGIYGSTSPCSLPLHLTTMSVAKKLPVNESQNGDDHVDLEQFECAEQQRLRSVSANARVRRGWVRRTWRRVVRPVTTVVNRIVEPIRGAWRKCPSYPNRHYQCIGMCGKECSCWRWVCGNCCFNRGCYEHDRCCEVKSWISCYIPLGFSCWSYFQYPLCLR